MVVPTQGKRDNGGDIGIGGSMVSRVIVEVLVSTERNYEKPTEKLVIWGMQLLNSVLLRRRTRNVKTVDIILQE